MMRRSSPIVVWAVFLAVAACGSGQKSTRATGLTARDIIDSSSPAIVRIEAGDSKVGTGFIVDPSGLIATNLHVIGGESRIRVKLYKDPAEYPATVVVGVDKDRDLALLRIKARRRLPTVKLGDSSAVSAGDRIYAIGNPLGVFDYSITDGLISQVRPLSENLTLLQISAAISLGSSGGPLFNQFGEVIGVTTAIIAEGQAINLAVPANYLRPMMKQEVAISLDEFARTTARTERNADVDDSVKIERKIPEHPVTLWAGCSQEQMEDVLRSIQEAIKVGAPLYNKQTPEGYEACFRIYEGTAIRYEKDSPCKGVREAFVEGLERAKPMKSYKEKAWAMRDTFDGLLLVAGRWCEQDAACRKKFGAPTPTPAPAPTK